MMEVEDRFLLPFLHPEVTGHGAVVLVGFAVTFLPGEVFALRNPDPLDDLLGGRLGPLAPVVGVINDGVTRVVGSPRSS